MTKGKCIALLAVLIMSFTANAGIITFDSISRIDNGSRIDTVDGGVATASRNLYNYPDGIRLAYHHGNPGNYAGGYYGERGQYFHFNNVYFLNSIDVMLEPIYHYWTVDSINILALDSDLKLLAERVYESPVVSNWVTLNFGVADVARVVIDFTGGSNAYGVGRYHAWIGVDNINYSDNVATVSEPGTLALLGLGLAGIAIARRKRRA